MNTKTILLEQNASPAWVERLRENPWVQAAAIFRQKPLAMFGLVGMTVILLITLFAPVIAPYDPTQLDYDHPLEGPSSAHWFGTDDLGRDVFSRVIYGGRESLRVGILAVTIALSGGIFFGLISGFFGGWVDMLIQRMVDILLAFPYILLLLSIISALGPGLGTIMIALGFAGIPFYTRLLRGSVLAARNYEYVTAARVVGLSSFEIMFRHILPNIIAPIIIYATLNLGASIMATSGLSYIGLGAQPPSAEWGTMLNAARPFILKAPWMSIFPGLTLFMTILFVNAIGDGLRDALDPKERR